MLGIILPIIIEGVPMVAYHVGNKTKLNPGKLIVLIQLYLLFDSWKIIQELNH
jgi:hypothetical protein